MIARNRRQSLAVNRRRLGAAYLARGAGLGVSDHYETHMHQRDFDPEGVERVLSILGLLFAVALAVAIPLLASLSA